MITDDEALKIREAEKKDNDEWAGHQCNGEQRHKKQEHTVIRVLEHPSYHQPCAWSKAIQS